MFLFGGIRYILYVTLCRLKFINMTTASSANRTMLMASISTYFGAPSSQGLRIPCIAARASACAVEGLSSAMISSSKRIFPISRLHPAASVRPSRMAPAPSVSVMLAPFSHEATTSEANRGSYYTVSRLIFSSRHYFVQVGPRVRL